MPLQFKRQHMRTPVEGVVVQYRCMAPNGVMGEISASAKVIACQGTIVIDGMEDMATLQTTLSRCVVHQQYLTKHQFDVVPVEALSDEEVDELMAKFNKKQQEKKPDASG